MKKLRLFKRCFKKMILKSALNTKEKSLTISKTSKTHNYLNYHIKIETKYYDILVLIINKNLLELIDDSQSGGIVNTIIGNHKKSQKSQTVISISKQKTLFGKIVVITPNIPKKTKMIINIVNQKKTNKKELIKKVKQNKQKEKIVKKEVEKKQNKIKQSKNKINPKINQIIAKEKETITNINNKTKTKYKLQKKKSKLVAVFNSVTASLLFAITLASITKKLIHGLLVATPFTLIHRTKKSNKTLIKKYQN